MMTICITDHEAYPRRFDVDMDTQMLGSVKPYNRQIVISTGKADWAKDITDDKDSLAALLLEVNSPPPATSPKSPSTNSTPASTLPKGVKHSTGLFHTSDSTRTSVLNGSHKTICHEPDHESVLVFPDFKVVTEVRRSMQGAHDLWEGALEPSIGRAGVDLEKSILKTWVLPYACVILLCEFKFLTIHHILLPCLSHTCADSFRISGSHKKRDNRCGIAAPKLEHAFIKSLEAQGWDADTQLEHPELTMGLPLEDLDATPEMRDDIMKQQMKESAESKRALIVKVSHVGGHKYAGNCIIYTPAGAGIWYGRVTPHDVDSIVDNTIIDGLVLPPLLRGGVNLQRPNCKSLNDW
ncbi:Sucrase/ferredoxin-like-domain-containing protein [Panaeolus papilionaceus]|nr:Sucrase/ferredoxin-like-domain-containing protein [Panaeolus papilionaceus]